MTGDEFLEKMSLIDPSFIEAADAIPMPRRRRPSRWVLLAACIGMLIGSVTVAMAVSGEGTRLIEAFTDRNMQGMVQSGYILDLPVKKFPVKDLKGQIRYCPDAFALQYQFYSPYQSALPGTLYYNFETRQEALDYVDLAAAKPFSWQLQEQATKLTVGAGTGQQIAFVNIETQYIYGNIRLQFYTNIYTEAYTGDLSAGSFTLESVEFTETYYTSASGKTCHILFQSALESGYLCVDGYLVVDGILYKLHIAYLQEDAANAETLMRLWADQF